jgi:hypothetical protein
MAGRYDLNIDQGSTFTRIFVYKDSNGDAIDLTGYSAQMMIRKSFNAAGEPIFDSDVESGSLTVTTPASGEITLNMTDDVTQDFPAPLEGVYDIEIDDGSGVVTRLLEGKVLVSPNVTRPDA